MKKLLLLFFISSTLKVVIAQQYIPAMASRDHVGRSAKVYGTFHFVNFDKANHISVFFIGSELTADRLYIYLHRISKIENNRFKKQYLNKDVAVKGIIKQLNDSFVIDLNYKKDTLETLTRIDQY